MAALTLESGVGLPVHPTLDLVRLNLRVRRGGYDIARGDVVAATRRSRIPMAFVHGEADALVPAGMASELFDACPAADKRLLVAPGAGHCQAMLSDPDAYWGAVDPLVERAVNA